jgi:hypothetical protein
LPSLVTGAGVIGCVAASLAAPARFFPSYLQAWLFVLGIALGAMAILMVHGLTGGRWGTRLVAPLLAAASLLPLLTLLAMPLILGLQVLYAWVPGHAPAIDIASGQRWYLNVPGFAVRGAACLLLWNGIAYLLRRGYRDFAGKASSRLSPALCIAGLIVYAITVTIASVDWIMSLTPEWYSSAFGLLIMTSQALSGFAFAVTIALWSARAELPGPTAQERNDLGNLLLMFVMLWAYIAFTQFLIVWAEDLPREATWYLARSHAGWRLVAVALAVLQFCVPMVALLFRAVKREPAALAALGVASLAAQWLYSAWLVRPTFASDGLQLGLIDLAVTCAIGGLCVAALRSMRLPSKRPHPAAEGA